MAATLLKYWRYMNSLSAVAGLKESAADRPNDCSASVYGVGMKLVPKKLCTYCSKSI